MVGFDPLANTGLGLRKKPIVGGEKSDIGKFSPDYASVVQEEPKASFAMPTKTVVQQSKAPTQPITSVTEYIPTSGPYAQQQYASTYQEPIKPKAEEPKGMGGIEQAKDTTINFLLSDLNTDISQKGLTIDEMYNLYPEIPKEIAGMLYSDLKAGSKINDIKQAYPELQSINPLANIPVSNENEYQYNAFDYLQRGAENLNQKAENINIPIIEPLVQGALSTAQFGAKGLRDITQAGASTLDRGIAGVTGTDRVYDRSVAEDIFDATQGTWNTALAVYAPRATTAFNTVMQTVPVEGQQKIGEVFNDVGSFVGKLPGVKQIKETLPEDRQQEFEQEVVGAMVGLILGTKNKTNIYKNPLKFFKQNLNPRSIAQNIQENVINIPVRKAGQVIKGATPIAQGAVEGGIAMVDNTLKGAKQATSNAMESVNKFAGGKPGEVGLKQRVLQSATGVDARNIKIAEENPAIFKDFREGKITKDTIKEELKSLSNNETAVKRQVGTIYDDVYSNPAKFDSKVVYDDLLQSLEKQGVIIENGKVTGYDPAVSTFTDSEFSAIKSKINNLSSLATKPRGISVKELHNIRKDIYNTSYSEGVSTKKAKGMDILSNTINDKYLKNIPGFAVVDNAFKEASDIAKEISDTVFNRQGEFKGNLKSLLNESQAKRLKVLEKYMPGISKKLEVMVANDDFIKATESTKTGLYEKARGYLGIAGGVTGGIPGAIIGGLADTVLGNIINNPKSLAKWITRNVGKEIATKIETGKTLSKFEEAKLKARFEIELAKANKSQALPYKGETKTTTIAKTNPEFISTKKGLVPKQKITEINDNAPRKDFATGKASARKVNEGLQAKSKQETANILTSKEFDKKGMNKVAGFGYGDTAPKVGDLTPKGKIVETTNTGGGYPTRRVKIEGDKGFIKADTVDIYRKGLQPKTAEKQGGMVEKTSNIESKGLEMKKDRRTELEDYLVRHSKARESYIKSVYETYSGDEAKAYIKEWDNKYGKQYTMVRKELGIAQTRRSKQEVQSEKIMKAIDDAKKESMPRDEAIKATDNDLSKRSVPPSGKRKYILDGVQKEYGFNVDDLSIADMNNLVKALHANTKVDTQIKVIEDIANRYGKKYMKKGEKIALQGLSQEEISKTVAKYFKPNEVSIVFREKIATPDGGNAFGAYHNKMIEFAKNPMKGTPEHEVVHAYIDLFKTNKQKFDILEHVLETRKLEVGAVKKKYGIADDYLGAEEFLADGFIKYAQGKATFTGQLKTYFQDLWNDVKNVFGKEDKVRKLYQDITGKKRPIGLQTKNSSKMFMAKKNIDGKPIVDNIKGYNVVDYGKDGFHLEKGNQKVGEVQFDAGKDYLKGYEDYVGIRRIQIDEAHQGKGIATELYKTMLNNLPEGKKGIVGISEYIRDDKINSIYKNLGATKDKKGNWILEKPKGLTKFMKQEGVDTKLIEEARKYKSADEFRRSEPKLTVSIDDLKPTDGHTYESTVGINGGPRKEYAGKPLLVSFTKDGKYQIHDGNHRYFLAKSKGDKDITVKLMNYTPFTKEENYHIDQLRKIREEANKGLPEKKFMKEDINNVARDYSSEKEFIKAGQKVEGIYFKGEGKGTSQGRAKFGLGQYFSDNPGIAGEYGEVKYYQLPKDVKLINARDKRIAGFIEKNYNPQKADMLYAQRLTDKVKKLGYDGIEIAGNVVLYDKDIKGDKLKHLWSNKSKGLKPKK